MRAPNLAPGIPDLPGGCQGGACPHDHPRECEHCRRVDPDGSTLWLTPGRGPVDLCEDCQIAIDRGDLDPEEVA